MPQSLFLEGPAGTGKTTYAVQHIRELLAQGIGSESVLVLVPQPTLGRPYQAAFAAPDWPVGAQIDVLTLGGLAQRGLQTFWPLVASKAGFAHPEWEPLFLTIETAQYYMARFVNRAIKAGLFDSVSITPFRIMTQTLDNLSRTATNRFTLDEVGERLIAAWGDRHSSRPTVYQASLDVAREFRAHCLENSMLDFSLQIEVFMEHLLREPLYVSWLQQQYRHLIVDNLEESFPVTADFLRHIWQHLDSALLVYDTDAGYRLFLGADPRSMYYLKDLCEEAVVWDEPVERSPVMMALAGELAAAIDPAERPPALDPGINLRDGFTFEFARFYPQMIDWVAERIAALIDQGVSPREIVVLAPFLGDSLRFALTTRLEGLGIKTVSHRPSRAVRDEPAARAMMTLMGLAHLDWEYRPPVSDVANMLQQVIEELDPVRAWLLAQIVYRPDQDLPGSFDDIEASTQERITYRAGEKYEKLRQWLIDYRPDAIRTPPDHFLSRLFGEILSQPGYGFHTHLDAGRIVAELVASARRFRQTLYPHGNTVEDWTTVTQEYFSLVQSGLLAGLYIASWRDEDQDAVFLAPAYTFLMRNRHVDYQFWLDVGSNFWWERLEQPLTHPYVLNRGYPADQVWTDDLEFQARRDTLRRLTVGLIRRCRKHIYISISNLGEQGYEQRGPLLQVIQKVMQRSEGII